jgi:adenylate kinase
VAHLNLILLGPPGSGKGTQGERLQEDLELPYYATGDILRAAVREGTEIGLEAKEYMDRGDLVPDEVIIGVIAERIADPEASRGFILDGFPRTLPQAEMLDDMLERQAMSVDGVIELAVPRDELVRRMLARKRADDDPAIFARRIESFEVQTAPLLRYYERQGKLASVDGLGTAEEIFERVRAAVKRFERDSRRP